MLLDGEKFVTAPEEGAKKAAGRRPDGLGCGGQPQGPEAAERKKPASAGLIVVGGRSGRYGICICGWMAFSFAVGPALSSFLHDEIDHALSGIDGMHQVLDLLVAIDMGGI